MSLSTALRTPGITAVVLSWPALCVLSACLAWAVDNNFTRKVSLTDATWIAATKGLVAGSADLVMPCVTSAPPLAAHCGKTARVSCTSTAFLNPSGACVTVAAKDQSPSDTGPPLFSAMQRLFHLSLSRRAVLFMAAVLLLAYAGLLQHQIVFHGGDNTECAQCLAASHFGHALPSTTAVPYPPATTERPANVAVAVFANTTTRHFSARAPPSFL